jgi:hypothetical protein
LLEIPGQSIVPVEFDNTPFPTEAERVARWNLPDPDVTRWMQDRPFGGKGLSRL